jgi:hypothetical protein
MKTLFKTALSLAVALLLATTGPVLAQENDAEAEVEGPDNTANIKQVFRSGQGSGAHDADLFVDGEDNLARIRQSEVSADADVEVGVDFRGTNSNSNEVLLKQAGDVDAEIDIENGDNNDLERYGDGRTGFARQGETNAEEADLFLNVENSDGNEFGISQTNDAYLDIDVESRANNNDVEVFQKGASTESDVDVDLEDGDGNEVNVKQGLNGSGDLPVNDADADVEITGEGADVNTVDIDQTSTGMSLPDDDAMVEITGGGFNSVTICQTNANSSATCL